MARIAKPRSDEVFVLRCYGIIIDVGGLIDLVNANPLQFPAEARETAALLEQRRADGIDAKYASGITSARRDEPLLIARIGDEPWIIDGNHRLHRRMKDGFSTTDVVVVSGDTLSNFVTPW